MTMNGIAQIVFYFIVLLGLAKPLGWYMARVYEGRPCGVDKIFSPVERLIYRLCAVRPSDEMDWKTYGIGMLVFNAAGLLTLYVLQRIQGLPSPKPGKLRAVSPDLAFNTAVSFRDQHKLASLRGRNDTELSDANGRPDRAELRVSCNRYGDLMALIRGLARRNAQTIGNFWVDLTRSTLYILLPLSLVLAMVLVSQGVVQTFGTYQTAALTANRILRQTTSWMKAGNRYWMNRESREQNPQPQPNRSSRSDLRRPRSRSSNSAPMVAASSM